jgi:hypothetical protein
VDINFSIEMDTVEELTEQIRKLENNFAEALAGNESQARLCDIWKKIRDLRSQIKLQANSSFSTENSKSSEIAPKVPVS